MAKKRPAKKSKRRKAIEWGVQALVVIVVLWGLTAWQGRHLISDHEPAPGFELETLDGDTVSLADARGRPAVIYFFAPWCTVCNYSSHNIVALREARPEEELAVFAVGLGWEDAGDVRRFARDHELNVPVLLGDERIQRDYKVTSFPTVYVVDPAGNVSDAVVGYTTELGLRLRSLM